MYPKRTQNIYPERTIPTDGPVQRTVDWFKSKSAARRKVSKNEISRILAQIELHQEALPLMSDAEISDASIRLRLKIRKVGLSKSLVAEAFAMIREAAHRTLGMRHFDVQMVGGWFMLQGMVAEMETGEGKTLTATLPACTAAMAGIPVHIVTVNDYLAQRDMEWMKPIYDLLHIKTGKIVHGMSPQERRIVYAGDVAYCTNKELAFDYLRDRLVIGNRASQLKLKVQKFYGKNSFLEKLVLRGLHYAIIDEADSILIDEARTPLIISGKGNADDQFELYAKALEIAKELGEEQDYTITKDGTRIRLTGTGKDKIKNLTQHIGGLWSGALRRETVVQSALSALHLYHCERDYIVKDGKVQIVDEFTGRLMADRSWEHGLQQLVELKEDCDMTSENETLARLSYQRFFRRFLHLSGMSGTVREVSTELHSVYGLSTFIMPTHKPVQRLSTGYCIYSNIDDKWNAVVQSALHMNRKGRPVLIGTRSIDSSEQLSRLMVAQKLQHKVLNAKQDKYEAEIIQSAGNFGSITIATNMAGRGTDIKIGTEVVSAGGLHVIATERHDARRIDRQLYGRCGRQGDPGTYEEILSLEDELFLVRLNTVFLKLLRHALNNGWAASRWMGYVLAGIAQKNAERSHAGIRKDLLNLDQQMDTNSALSGNVE